MSRSMSMYFGIMSRRQCVRLIAGCVLLIVTVTAIGCRREISWYWNYLRITNGMSLSEVERVLGEGKSIDSKAIQSIDYDQHDPEKRVHPVVIGDERFLWQNENHFRIVVGFRNGVVCDKWYSIPLP
jgi:hypothetical protein